MGEFIDATRELRELAALASNPNAINEVLDRSLAALKPLIPYDLAAVLALEGDRLAVRAATGPLSSRKVREHSIALANFPTIQRAVETRRPIALLEHHHSSEEGDPYHDVLELPDGHSCMVVPLFAGDRTLGAMTFDRKLCQPYPQETVELAGIYGQIIALALAYAEQAALLDRYRRRLQEQQAIQQEDAGESGSLLAQSLSLQMQQLVLQARQVAVTSTCVLIQGETGAGKEVLAQAIHEWSDRSRGPFIKINCAAIPENLVESELFGHAKGAFTGASEKRSGRFLVANGDAVFG